MIYQEFLPDVRLRSTIECYWQVAGAGSEVFRPIFPDGCTDLIFNFGSTLLVKRKDQLLRNSHRAFVVGNMTFPTHTASPGSTDLLGVRFRPAGLSQFLRVPLYELTDDSVSAEDLGCAHSLTDQMERLALPARVQFLNNYFLGKKVDQLPREAWVLGLQLIASNPARSIYDVTRASGLSRKQLERKFKDFVGLSPKQFAQVLRFRNVCRDLSYSPDLLTTAIDHHFTDQAHLTHFFRQFSHLTPSQYRALHL